MLKGRKLARTNKNDAFVFVHGKKTKMLNLSNGGMCIQNNEMLNFLQEGMHIKVVFQLCRTKIVEDFVVRYILNDKIGLQFADEKTLSPQQRVIAYQN